METLSSQLQTALNSLTPTNWRKGSYFKIENNHLCMCAHGAVQAVCNPQAKLAVENLDLSHPYADPARAAAAPAAATGAVAGIVACTDDADLIASGKSPQEVWNSRPDYVKKDYIYKDKNYGNGDLHWLLGMVGLTISYNDAPDTTLEMVQSKFREAIALAKELEA